MANSDNFNCATSGRMLRLAAAEVIPTKVTQGNTLYNNEERHAATHAIDKDLSTVAAADSDNGGGWLKLESSTTYFILTGTVLVVMNGVEAQKLILRSV